MAETEPTEMPAPSSKMAILAALLIAVIMFAASIWGGGEMARGEIAQQNLDASTARASLVKARVTVPAGTAITADMLEPVDTYANRAEPYCLTRTKAAIGHKTKFGLERGQILTVKDLD